MLRQPQHAACIQMQRRAQGPQQCGHRPVLGPEADLLRGERGIADPFPCPADREYRVDGFGHSRVGRQR
ncbi:hypothetical protein AB1339_32520 [Streptomyces cyaneofuscatus]